MFDGEENMTEYAEAGGWIMIVVNKSTIIKKWNLKSTIAILIILAVGIGPILFGRSLFDSDEATGVVLIICGIVSMIVGIAILMYIRRKAHLKYRNSFFEELSARGFKRDVVFDSGALRYGDPAVMAVDYLRHEVAVMFYNNPESPYLIPAGLIKNVWNGYDDSENTVYASFGFCVNGAEVTVPTKIRRHRYHYSIDSRPRQRYVNGKCRKAFNEAVEKADEFATVLKKLTALK